MPVVTNMFGAGVTAVAADPECMSQSTHDGSWSANLEQERHAESPEVVVTEALDAVRATEPGYHVNLVTHGEHGHPRTYLWEPLEELDRDLAVEYVEQCGCGGHVTRVHVQ
jgi:putative CGCGG family rSAM target protein